MDIRINLICIGIYDEKYKYIDNMLTSIPEKIVNIINKILDKNIKKLIKIGSWRLSVFFEKKIGNFDMNDDDSYLAGFGNNYRLSYVNSNCCNFVIVYYYDSSNYDINVYVNQQFNKNTLFMDVINDMKSIKMLWKNKFKDLSISEIKKQKQKYKYTNTTNYEEIQNDDW